MFSNQFSNILKQKRLMLKNTQTQMEELCSLVPGRWSDLEAGRRRPSGQELQAIGSALQLGRFYVPSPAGIKSLMAASIHWLPVRPPFYASQDRTTHIRFKICLRKYGETAQGLLELVKQRADFERCHHLSHLLACGSGLEALYILSLLAAGAEPGFLAPSSLGHTPLRIVDVANQEEVGTRLHPCLKLGDTFYFFRVTFLKGSTYTVNVLKWAGAWRVVEFLGLEHWSTDGVRREQVMGIPTDWISESDVLRNAVQLNTIQRAG